MHFIVFYNVDYQCDIFCGGAYGVDKSFFFRSEK